MASKDKKVNETDIKNVSIPIIIVVVALLCLSLVLTVNNSVKDKPKDPDVNYDYDDEGKSKLNLSEEEAGNMINNIILIARDIYEKGTYTQFNKGSYGYYATLAQIRTLGYENIDSMVIGCDDGHAIMFFDVDNKDKYPGYPVMVVHECTGVTLK